MATYLELLNLSADADLRDRTKTAVTISAQALIDGTPTVDQQKWAASVLGSPGTEAAKALRYVLAVNNGLSVVAIQGASDSAIQAQVDAAVDALVIAFNAV
jgi:hypothetical protein